MTVPGNSKLNLIYFLYTLYYLRGE